MKRSKITAAQIAFVLKQAEDGTPVAEVCRKAGVAEATFYNWRKRYAGLMPSEVRQLRQLEEENGKLKRIVADLSLDDAMLQDVLAKTVWSAPALQGFLTAVGRSLRNCIRLLASGLRLQPGHDEMRAHRSQIIVRAMTPVF